MTFNGFDSRIFPLPNHKVLTKPENPSSSEKSISPKSPASSDHSSDYYEYISPEKELTLLAPKKMLQILRIKLEQLKHSIHRKTY